MGPPEEIRSWIKVLKYRDKGDLQDREKMKHLIRERLDGYIGVTDAPCTQLIPKLLEIYPNARIICTTRGPQIVGKEPDTDPKSGSDVLLTSRSTPPARYARFPGLYRSRVYPMGEIVP
ncbi:hypothetical protein VI817_005898 [Penicillium citrinum]|nr:hypothetical protein VI817_005898 [Penicillium citrinum]